MGYRNSALLRVFSSSFLATTEALSMKHPEEVKALFWPSQVFEGREHAQHRASKRRRATTEGYTPAGERS
jgi:hypothetical protein